MKERVSNAFASFPPVTSIPRGTSQMHPSVTICNCAKFSIHL